MYKKFDKKKVSKLISLIQNNDINIKFVLCIDLEPLAALVCKEVCQIEGLQYMELNNSDKINIENFIKVHNIDTLFNHKKDIRVVNDLLWTCPSLKQYICIDTDDISQESEGKTKLMNKRLWDFTCNNAADDIESGGWINSYTRKKFSKKEIEDFIRNTAIKLSPYLDITKKVLEIGCSSGFTMFSFAPVVKEYIAIDMSSNIISKNKERISKEIIDNIHLYCLYAHELETLSHDNFDVVIINSVIHCFEGHLYFKRILKMLIKKMGDKGLIFLGDIMDLEKKSEFEESLLTYKKKHGTNTKVDFSQELFLSRFFFEDLYFDYPEIVDIEISEKHFTIKNELSQYRYDVLIKIDKKAIEVTGRTRHKNQYSCDIFN